MRSCYASNRKVGENQTVTNYAVSEVEVAAHRMTVSNTLTLQVIQLGSLEDPQYEYHSFCLIGEGVVAERIRTLGS